MSFPILDYKKTMAFVLASSLSLTYSCIPVFFIQGHVSSGSEAAPCRDPRGKRPRLLNNYLNDFRDGTQLPHALSKLLLRLLYCNHMRLFKPEIPS